jgi:hypothetical protein
MDCADNSYDSFSSQNLKFKLYDSLQDRNQSFGYNYTLNQRVNDNYHNSYFEPNISPPQAPKNYYFQMHTDPNIKSTLSDFDFQDIRPNLYNDNVLPTTPTFEYPDLYRNWKPFTTTARPIMKNCYTTYVPHEPVEVAPKQTPKYWEADLNARMYERSVIVAAEENPYVNYNRRQVYLGLLAKDMSSKRDTYTQKVSGPEETFAYKLRQNNGIPPAVTNF